MTGNRKTKRILLIAAGIVVIAAVLAAVLIWNGRKSSSESTEQTVENAVGLIGKTREEVLDTMGITEADMTETLAQIYRVSKQDTIGNTTYHPYLEFWDHDGTEELLRYGFGLDNVSAEDALKLSQDMLVQISAVLGLEESVPADNTYDYEDGSHSSDQKGISDVTPEDLEKAQTCQLTEVWNKDDSMYFQATFQKTAGESGEAEYILSLSYVTQPTPAYAS